MSTSTSCQRASRTGALAVLALVPAVAAWFSPGLAAQDAQFRETIVIEQVVIDARVVDRSGNAVLGLTDEDFHVLVDGQPVELVSVEWVSGNEPYAEGLTPEQAAEAGILPAAPGRLVIIFFQTDFVPTRMTGIFRMVPKALEIIDDLNPDDHVAVLSYDSHLKLHQDFTTDREALRDVIKTTTLFQEPPPTEPGPHPSIAAFLNPQAAKDATSPEQALYLTAQALETIPGAKSMIFLGWGLGRFRGRAGVLLGSDYARARAALVDARVAVYALDVTDADYHDLEVGLEAAAHDTGGFYQKTHLFPDQAVRRVNEALAGHYVLVFSKPKLPPGTHKVDVEVVGRKGEVLGQYSYTN